LQHARDDRPGDRDESANLVRDRIALPALPYFHGGSVSLLHDRRKLQNLLMMARALNGGSNPVSERRWITVTAHTIFQLAA